MSEISDVDISFPETGSSEVNEVTESNDIVEMDEELSQKLDDVYNAYIEDGRKKSIESKVDESDGKLEEESNAELDELDEELDDTHDEYMNDMSEYECIDSSEIKEISEVEGINDLEDDSLESELENKYNQYIKEGREPESLEKVNEDGFHELSKEKKQEICRETGWSEDTVDMMKSKEEAEIYKNADLKEEEIDGKKCLIRSDIDMKQRDEFGRTNKERMENGNPPLTENGETVELHHIGQKQNSPLAELAIQEHRGKGNDTILHDKQKESEIERNEFAKERKQHWESRSEKL